MMSHEAKPYFQTDFKISEFKQRRQRIAAEIGEAVAVLQGAPDTGSFESFRQSNEFYYLCGVETPHAYLLIGGTSGNATLYLPPHDPKHERSEGKVLHADAPAEVRQITGFDEVKPLSALADDLAKERVIFALHKPPEGKMVCRDVAQHAQNYAKADPWSSHWPPAEQRFIEKQSRAAPKAEFRDLSPILDEMRIIKSSREIELMRAAGKLAALAVTEAMCCTRPGLIESQIGAPAEYLYALNGARGAGYRPIIAGGPNIWNAHYYRNNCVLNDGDLVLMDYAPDYRYYTSDIGRIWPVNGKYNAWQRELYGFVVEYHKTLLSLIRPGVTADKIDEEAAGRMLKVIESRKWSKPAFEAGARDMLKYHGHLSHGVGMAVHDAGSYKKTELKPGMVFALDPQMWIPSEQLYIRVEDTVVVTESGNENLTSDAPFELDDVERSMRDEGLLQRIPPLAGYSIQ